MKFSDVLERKMIGFKLNENFIMESVSAPTLNYNMLQLIFTNKDQQLLVEETK